MGRNKKKKNKSESTQNQGKSRHQKREAAQTQTHGCFCESKSARRELAAAAHDEPSSWTSDFQRDALPHFSNSFRPPPPIRGRRRSRSPLAHHDESYRYDASSQQFQNAPLPDRAPLPYYRPSTSPRRQSPVRSRSRSRSPLVDRVAPGRLSPSPAYLSAISETPPLKSSLHPPLLVLDLNETLVLRGRKDYRVRKTATPRPYLSTFLEYICGWTAAAPGKPSQKRWNTAVYSSGAQINVLPVLRSIALAPPSTASLSAQKGWIPGEGDHLSLLWTRENLGLEKEEFQKRVRTVKDLEEVWSALPGCGLHQTLLLDDEKDKACLQPFNHIPIAPYVGTQNPVTPTDTALLRTIYILEDIREKKSFPSFIQNGGLDPLFSSGNRLLEMLARRVCVREGIEVRKDWDPLWADRIKFP